MNLGGISGWIKLDWRDDEFELYTDAACSNEIEYSGYVPGFGIVDYKLYKMPDEASQIPSVIYVRPDRWWTDDVTNKVCETGAVSLAFLTEPASEIYKDEVQVYRKNTPAYAPNGYKVYTWSESVTITGQYSSVQHILEALTNDWGGQGLHNPDYYIQNFRETATEDNCTPSAFLDMRDAVVAVGGMHGDPGWVFPKVFSNETAAIAWSNDLAYAGTKVGYSPGWSNWYVKVPTTYFQQNWKATRDQNRAIYMALTCYASISNSDESLPSFLSSVGGSFAYGSTTTCNMASSDHYNLIRGMRLYPWRTAYGVLETDGIAENIRNGISDMDYAGTGKITLWPSAMDTFPKEWHQTGYGYVPFDTIMEQNTGAVAKVSGDVTLTSGLSWFSTNSVVKWSYSDPGTASSTMRAVSSNCVSKWGPGTSSRWGRNLAGDDGMTCGKNKDWSF